MHIHPGNLMIVISGIIIDSLICVTAGGVDRDLTITILKLAAAPLLVYGIQNMKNWLTLSFSPSPETEFILVNAALTNLDCDDKSPGRPIAPMP